jgi:pimeloyl-ACP methyl ester carboxylesterase
MAQYLKRIAAAFSLAFIASIATPVFAAGQSGVVILHGNGETPANVSALAYALRIEGLLVATPEMPWSSRRLYDRNAADADRDVDSAIEGTRTEGAQRVYVIGQSLGASYALRYGSRPGISGIVAIAPGHAPESPLYARSFADELTRARGLIAQGRPQAMLEFLDMQWGGRRSRSRTTAGAFLSYFDAAGPMNLTRIVQQLGPDKLMLWIVPTDDAASRQWAVDLYGRTMHNPGSLLVEIPGPYQSASPGMVGMVTEWIRESAAHIRGSD